MMPRSAKLPSLNNVNGAHGGRKARQKGRRLRQRVHYEFRDATVNGA